MKNPLKKVKDMDPDDAVIGFGCAFVIFAVLIKLVIVGLIIWGAIEGIQWISRH